MLAFLFAVDAPGVAIDAGARVSRGVPTFAQTISYGRLRLRSMRLRDATAADGIEAHTDDARALVFETIVSIAGRSPQRGRFEATLLDAAGLAIVGKPLDAGWDLAPGDAARTSFAFVPPQGFAPAALALVECEDPARAFRISIRASDLPAPSPEPL